MRPVVATIPATRSPLAAAPPAIAAPAIPAQPVADPAIRPARSASIVPGTMADMPIVPGATITPDRVPADVCRNACAEMAAAGKRKARDWADPCRYAAEHDVLVASARPPRVMFTGDSIT